MNREMLIKTSEFDFSDVEVSKEEKRAYFAGYVLKYGVYDQHGDKFQYGSFTKTLNDWAGKANKIIPIRSFEHAMPLGGVLEWEDRPEGLYLTKAFLDMNTSGGVEHYSLMKNKIICGMSMQGPLYRSDGNQPFRTITEAGLRHIAVTDDPAQTGSSIELMKTLLSHQFPVERLTDIYRAFESLESPGTPSDDTFRADEEMKKTALILTDINKTLSNWRTK